jgi:hypothetical protein
LFIIFDISDDRLECFDEELIQFDFGYDLIFYFPISKKCLRDVGPFADEHVKLFNVFHLRRIVKIIEQTHKEIARGTAGFYFCWRRDREYPKFVVSNEPVDGLYAGHELKIKKSQRMTKGKVGVVFAFSEVLLNDVDS